MVTARVREPPTEPPRAQREETSPAHNRSVPAAPGGPVSSTDAPPPQPPRPAQQEVSIIAKPLPTYAEAAKGRVAESVGTGVGGFLNSITSTLRGSARPTNTKQPPRETVSHKRKGEDAAPSSREIQRKRDDDPGQSSRDRPSHGHLSRRRGEDTGRHQKDTQKKREEEPEGVLIDTTELLIDLDESPQEREAVPPRTHGKRENRPQSLHEREQEQREKNKALSARLQLLEAQNDQLQGHIQKMSHIIQQLQRQGLPQPPDDGHFSREFEELTGDVRQWARLASKGQPPMTEVIWNELGPEMRDIICPAFSDLQEVLANNPSKSLRTRFIEVIIFRDFQECIFGKRVIGISRSDYSNLDGLWNSILVGESASERDLHCWSALTVHLLTKDNESFDAKRELKVNKAAKKLAEQLKPLGAPGQATIPELRQMLFRAARLSLQIAQLPFILTALHLQPGMPFQHKIMEDINNEGEGEELEICSVNVNLMLFPTVVKMDFDCNGNKVDNASYTADMVVISKGMVVCEL